MTNCVRDVEVGKPTFSLPLLRNPLRHSLRTLTGLAASMHAADVSAVLQAESRPTAQQHSGESADSKPGHASKSEFWSHHEADMRGRCAEAGCLSPRAHFYHFLTFATSSGAKTVALTDVATRMQGALTSSTLKVHHARMLLRMPQCRNHGHKCTQVVAAAALPTTYWARQLEVDRTDWNLYLRFNHSSCSCMQQNTCSGTTAC